MKKLSNIGLKICLIIAILMGIFGTTFTVEASLFGSGALSAITAIGKTVLPIIAQIGSQVLGTSGDLANQIIPVAFDATKELGTFLLGKAEERLQEKIDESVVEDDGDEMFTEDDGDEMFTEDDGDEMFIEDEKKGEKVEDKKEPTVIVASKYGDVDCNGTVDQEDMNVLMNHILKIEEIPSEQGIANADVNLDNEIDGYDFYIIVKYLDKEIEELPEERIIYGDINDDKKVDMLDIEVLVEYIDNMEEYDLDEQAKIRADVNLDDEIDELDVKCIEEYIEDNYKSLPVKEDMKEEEFDEKDITFGDIDGNKVIDEEDFYLLYKYVLKIEEIPSKLVFTNADVYLDGKVDGYDYVVLANNINGKIEKLPVEPVEEPEVEEPKVEEPKVEEPKVEEPKVEEPKVEEPETQGLLKNLLGSNSLFKRLISKKESGSTMNIFSSDSSTASSLSEAGLTGVQLLKKVLNSELLNTVVTQIVPSAISTGSQLASSLLSMI